MGKLNVLYEDNHIIVVEKDVNLLSQGDITGDDNLLDRVKLYIKEKYNKPGNVYVGLLHRLDRVVGGVMVFAKTSKAASRLSLDIKNHNFYKEYIACCHGKVERRGEFIDNLIKLDTNTIVRSDGKRSELSYELLEYNSDKDISLVKIKLKTGRHHQIRVQFASRNHPLCSDNRYGKETGDIALFAYKLSFYHPISKELLTFSLIPNNRWFNYFKIEDLL